MDLVIQEGKTGKRYCRSNSNQSLELCDNLTKCYPCKGNRSRAIITASGLSAISVTLQGLLISLFKNSKINIIVSNELYPDTSRILNFLTKIYNFNMISFDVTNQDHLVNIFENEVKSEVNILYFESASNPNGNIFDYSIIPKLKKLSKTLHVVVDNTWLTHVIFNPFEYYADFIIISMTKYSSGGNCVAGAIICKNAFYGK